MDRELLAHFPVVLAVAHRGGIAAAAAAQNMSPTAVSHAVKEVEQRRGQRLFARTTRSVALTEAGTRFVAAIGPALAQIDETVQTQRAPRGHVAGALRIDAPRVALPPAITAAVIATAGRSWCCPLPASRSRDYSCTSRGMPRRRRSGVHSSTRCARRRHQPARMSARGGRDRHAGRGRSGSGRNSSSA